MDIYDLMNEMREVVNGLRQSSTEIAEAISSIKNISKRTNLLALNASIESSNVGGDRRGSVVVATEIRKLSSQTAEFSGQIDKIILAILNQIVEIAEKFEKCMNKIEEGKKNTIDGEKAFNEIQESNYNVQKDVESINLRVNQMLENINSIASSVKK